MGAPFVVAGCPARNRAWALPGWWSALQGQTVKPEHALILLNDCEDASLGEVQSLAEGSSQKPELHYEVLDTGVAGWHRGTRESGWKSGPHPRYHEDSHANLAFLRNRWVELCLERYPQATHLFSVDSDIQPEPDVLELLLAADKPVVGAVVRNSKAAWNFMCGATGAVDGIGTPYRNGQEAVWLDGAVRPFEVTLVGACTLFEADLFRGQGLGSMDRRDGFGAAAGLLRWGPHPRGEDVALAIQACELGIGLWLEPRAKTSHFMRGEGEEPLR